MELLSDAIVGLLSDGLYQEEYAELPTKFVAGSKREQKSAKGQGAGTYDTEKTKIKQVVAEDLLNLRRTNQSPVWDVVSKVLPCYVNNARFKDSDDVHPVDFVDQKFGVIAAEGYHFFLLIL